MGKRLQILGKESGFTVIELLVAFVIVAILVTIAIPTFAVWLPNYRLRNATQDVYSNYQLAKLTAIRSNRDARVVFDPGTSSYAVWTNGPNRIWDGGPSTDDVLVKSVNFADYGSGVGYGHGNATQDMTGGGSWGDHISHATNSAIFQANGTVANPGYVYLSNSKNVAYVVGTPNLAGVVLLRKWAGGSWQ